VGQKKTFFKAVFRFFFIPGWAISGREFFGGDNLFERT
jgi:hypothetical protein